MLSYIPRDPSFGGEGARREEARHMVGGRVHWSAITGPSNLLTPWILGSDGVVGGGVS